MINLPLGKAIDGPISLKAHTAIFLEGEISKYLFIIKSGEVRLLKSSTQHLSVIGLCKAKDILNEVSVLSKKPLTFSAVTKTEVELILIEQSDILSVIKNAPKWVGSIFETLCERLISTAKIIEDHNLMAGEKSADLVLSKAEETKCLEAMAQIKK